MALLNFKTGTIDSLTPEKVPLEEGTVYFAVDPDTKIGQIVYDVSDGKGGLERVVMSTWAEKADTATEAERANNATAADVLSNSTNLDGITYNGSNNVIHYATCASAANAQAKSATINNFDLVTGARVIIKYTNGNTADSPTLNISNTGNKAILARNSNISSKDIKAGDVHEYIYDGTAWNYVGTLVFDNVSITVNEDEETLYISDPISNADEESY